MQLKTLALASPNQSIQVPGTYVSQAPTSHSAGDEQPRESLRLCGLDASKFREQIQVPGTCGMCGELNPITSERPYIQR